MGLLGAHYVSIMALSLLLDLDAVTLTHSSKEINTKKKHKHKKIKINTTSKDGRIWALETGIMGFGGFSTQEKPVKR